jgi:hypothetical protein
MKLYEIITLTEMNRRDFLKGAAAVGAASFLPTKKVQADIPNWIPITKTYYGKDPSGTEGFEMYYDKNSLQKNGNIIKVWVRANTPRESLMMQYVIDKSNKTAHFYLPGEGGGWSKLEPIQPGSFEQIFLDVLQGNTFEKQAMAHFKKEHPNK